MKKLVLLILISFNSIGLAQTLVHYFQFPRYTPYNSFWGITERNDTLWIGSDSNGFLYKVTKQGAILDSLVTPYNFNHGVEWAGDGYWIAEQFRTAGARIFKVNTSGAVVDTIVLPPLIGGNTGGVGDIALDGNALWFSVYSPDFLTYPFAYAYKVDLTTKAIVDTIPLRGRQVYGLTVKGDTIFYVNDNLHGEVEKIYAYSQSLGDTVLSFAIPDPDGDCSPRGLYWDGNLLWLVADRIGNNQFLYKALYAYDVFGAGTPIISTVNSISFGDVIIGVPQERFLSVSNIGTGNLIIDSITTTSNLFTVLPVANQDTISPGSSKNYFVTFNPVAFGNQAAVLRIYSNDAGTPVKEVNLTARGIFGPAHLSFSENPSSFGSKRVNSTSYREITITNEGSGNLLIDSVSLNSTVFYLQWLEPPVSLDSVQSTSFRVWFNPLQITNYQDTIRFYSNASNGNVLNLVVNGNGSSFNPALGNVVWQGQVPDNPATTFNQYNPRSMKKISDISGDGVDDIIIATENYWTIAYNGNSSGTADILWKFSSFINNNNAGSVDYVQGLQIADDLDGDGYPDVVIGTGGGNEFVYALNGRTGELLWEHGDGVNFNNGDIMGVDVKRDWNNDGVPDVLVAASGNESTGQGRFSVILLDGRNGTVIWQISQAAQQKLKYMVTSTDFGGAVGSRVGTLNEVFGFNKTGQIVWTFVTSGTPWTVVEMPNIGGGPSSDVLVGTTTGNVYVLSGDNGSVIWQTNIGNVFIEDARVVTDVNDSGTRDIFISGINPNAYLLEGSTGQTLWSVFTGGNILGIGELGDINGDAIPELGTASLNNQIHVFDARVGTTLFNYSFGGGGTGTAAEHIEPIDDVDLNGSLEFVAGSRDGRIIAFSGGTEGIPVELSSFNASVSGTDVNLIWTTASEVNNRGFEIERNNLNEVEINWTKIAFVEGKGTTTETKVYNYVDANLEPGNYKYRLKQIDYDGTFSFSNEVEVIVGIPNVFSLEQNYPNPFNPVTIIRFAIPVESNVRLSIYNLLGEEVRILKNEQLKAGSHQVEWRGTDNNNNLLPSGVYFYRIESGDFVDVKKMLFMK